MNKRKILLAEPSKDDSKKRAKSEGSYSASETNSLKRKNAKSLLPANFFESESVSTTTPDAVTTTFPNVSSSSSLSKDDNSNNNDVTFTKLNDDGDEVEDVTKEEELGTLKKEEEEVDFWDSLNEEEQRVYREKVLHLRNTRNLIDTKVTERITAEDDGNSRSSSSSNSESDIDLDSLSNWKSMGYHHNG